MLLPLRNKGSSCCLSVAAWWPVIMDWWHVMSMGFDVLVSDVTLVVSNVGRLQHLTPLCGRATGSAMKDVWQYLLLPSAPEHRHRFYVTIVMHLRSYSSGGTTKFLTWTWTWTLVQSKITNDNLTRSGTGCFIVVPLWQQFVSKG